MKDRSESRCSCGMPPYEIEVKPIPLGLCQCGCGEKTRIAKQSDKRYGLTPGERTLYLRGHRHRKSGVNLEIAVWALVARGDRCWEWQGRKNETGYGVFNATLDGKTRPFLAHRLAYRFFYREDPGELGVCHKCDNPLCCNPHHLFLGDQAANTADMRRKGRNGHGAVRGSASPRALLTEETVLRIREAYAVGNVIQQQLAEQFGIDRSTISNIVTRRTWKHV